MSRQSPLAAPTLADIRAARTRIAPHVRRTPVVRAAPLHRPIAPGELWLKLESLQITGSFKARGAANTIRALPASALARGVITASGGNHGLAVAYAGWLARLPATIYLPVNTPPAKVRQFEAWGARIVIEGDVWDEANRAALATAERDGLTYVHPFADPLVIAGQGTVGLEILEDLPSLDVVVVAIGGGGLIAGIATAVKALRPAARIIGVEPAGAPTLHESLRAGRLVELDAIRTAATTLAPRRSEAINLDIIRRSVDGIVLVDDDEMRAAARWLWQELGVASELSAAAGIAALQTGKIASAPDERVCVLICAAGDAGLEPGDPPSRR